MTLQKVLEIVERDSEEQGLYALWVKHDLPDVGEYAKVTGINHCTVIISTRDGIVSEYPKWLYSLEPDKINAQRITYLNV